MKKSDTFNIVGCLTAELFKSDGTYEVTHKHNAILNVGFDFIADSIGNSSSRPAPMGYIALGTGTTAVTGTQTELVSQLMAKAATYAHDAGTKVFTFETTFNKGEATGALTEASVQNAETGGTLIDRVVFPVINKGAEDTLKMTFTFTMSQSS